MSLYKREIPIDMEQYAPHLNETAAKYGLPGEVKYCSSCVISNQRPNSAVEFMHTAKSEKKTIKIDEDGVCDACRVAESKKKEIDWDAREAELRALCDKYRSADGSYDCLVPGSGGKDSFYAAHKLKYEYGMHPLTVTWAPHMYTDWGRENFYGWLNAGFDNILVTPNPRVHRLLTRLSVENLFHPFQPFMIGQKLLAPRMALRFNIPLVFYGENEAEYGNPQSDVATPRRASDYFSRADLPQVYLGGVAYDSLLQDFGLEKADLDFYLPTDEKEIAESNIQVHYLGYYLKWHPQGCYYYAIEHGNFRASPERTPGTYSKYNSIDDKIDDLHYYTTYIKFGIGRATYDAAQEIRSGEIERDEGVALVRRFDGEFPARFEKELWEYLSIPEKEYPVASKMFEQPIMDHDYFMHLADRFRSPHLWMFEDGQWKLRQGQVETI